MADYAVTVDGTTLASLGVAWARFTKWTAGAKRASNLILPYKHGEFVTADKYFSAADVLLEVGLPDPGAAGDTAQQTLSDIQELFSGQSEVPVQRTDPALGTIRARCELLTEPVVSQQRFAYLFGLRNASGFWEDASTSSAVGAPPSVTTAGDRPVDDFVISFPAANTWLEHTDSIGQVSRVTIDTGAGGTTPYLVDVGAGTVVDTVGVAKDEFLTVTQAWWMKFAAAGAQSLTSSGSITVTWRNKFA